MGKISYLIMLMFIVGVAKLSAQMPSLEIDKNKNQEKVYLKALDIKVDVLGNVSTTTMTMVFQNKTPQILEGTLVFPLPEGATVSGYALDINGKMRKAVAVDKSKGTQVFEEIERRRVDPGLLEKVEGNNFRTRIYPIPSNSSRTVSIVYEEVMTYADNKYIYRLPMDYKEPLQYFDLALNVWQDAKPIVNAGADEIKFTQYGNAYVSKFNAKNYQTPKLLSFTVPTQSTPEVVMQAASGSYYFALNYFIKKKEKRKKQWGKTIGILWDASLSLEKRDAEKELMLLDALISETQNLTVKLGFLNNTFTNGGTFEIKNGDWSELRKALSAVTYDGGTNYRAIDLDKIQSDEYLLFSDGISTLSEATFPNKKSKPIHCIVSSPSADYSSLKTIAFANKGKFINLNKADFLSAKNEMLYDSYRLLGIKNNSDISQVYPSIPTNVEELVSVAGITNKGNSELVLQFGYDNHVTDEQIVYLEANKNVNNEINVHKIWAQKKIAELDLNYDKNKEDITALSQQFGIVTRNTSLIVLELMSDYIQYGITPPQELMEEYNAYLQSYPREQRRDQQLIAEKTNLFEKAETDMVELKKWWDTDFKIPAAKYPVPNNANQVSPIIPPNTYAFTKSAVQASTAASSEEMVSYDIVQDDEMQIQEEEMLSEVIVDSESFAVDSSTSMSAMKIQKSNKETDDTNNKSYVTQQAKIELLDIKNDAEYMKRLTGNTSDDYQVYLQERNEYGSTPSFYFNMADWFMKHNDKEKALRVLTSIAEIGLENIPAYKMLAFRLKEYKEPEILLFVTKKLMDWRPFEQQSFRDYALALKENGQYQAALDSLYSCMLRPLGNTQENASLGMNMVLLSEINNLITLHKEDLNTKAIDSQFIYSMPVDIRVVGNWNADLTHIDMHITDPSGETVTYNHYQSVIGGRMDAHEIMDFGPEQFLLKKGMKGKYSIKVDYWGDSAVNSKVEPATIETEIYISYSDGKQERRIVCFNLSNANIDKAQKQVTIAEFEL